MYEKAASWIRDSSEKHGDAADLMRRAKAQKSSWYKFTQGKGVRLETFFDWLENLGFELRTPEEREREVAREVRIVNTRIINTNGLTRPPDHDDYLAVPLVAEAGAGAGIFPTSEDEQWFLVDRRERSLMLKTNLIAVRIAKNSTSMEPTLSPGDVVLVDRDDRDVSRPDGIWLVMDPDGAGKVKRISTEFVRPRKLTRVIFYSDNAQGNPPEVYTLEDDYEGEWNRAIVGRVVWAWSDLSRK